jgi:hypothetical protein
VRLVLLSSDSDRRLVLTSAPRGRAGSARPVTVPGAVLDRDGPAGRSRRPVASSAVAEAKEVWAGDTLVVFDGRVVELFGFPGRESARFHVRNMELEIGEPNRNGRRGVTIKPASRGGGYMLEVDERDWAEVGPLLDRVLAAIPGADSRSTSS